MGTEWGANQGLLKIMLFNQSLGLPQGRLSNVTALQCVVPTPQIWHLGIHFPNSPLHFWYPFSCHAKVSASCPPWTCCLGAVELAGVYMVDLAAFSVVMDQPQLLCCLAEWPALQLPAITWGGKRALSGFSEDNFSLCFCSDLWWFISLKEISLLVYLQGLKVDSSLCQVMLARLKPSVPEQPFPGACSSCLCPCQSASVAAQRGCVL